MPRSSFRMLLTLSSTALFLYALFAYRPGFGAGRGVEALLGGVASFWLVYLIGTIVLAIVYALVSLGRGVPADRIGLKDERDRVVERRAYAVGFWVLFLGSFAAILAVGSDHNQMLVTVILTQVGAIGAILLVGLVDELRMLALSRNAD